jgi:7-cyano-7-deazaguanine synthase
VALPESRYASNATCNGVPVLINSASSPQSERMPPPQAIVLLSGGIDSAACAHLLKAQGMTVEGVFLDYGQPAALREHVGARAIAEHLGISLFVITSRGPAKLGPGEVTGRNAFLIFSSMVLGPRREGILAIGIHSGTAYYDCSTAFMKAIGALVAEHTDGALTLLAPFLEWNKKQVFDYFTTAALPIDLTYSCEAGNEVCAVCNSCKDRSALGC